MALFLPAFYFRDGSPVSVTGEALLELKGRRRELLSASVGPPDESTVARGMQALSPATTEEDSFTIFIPIGASATSGTMQLHWSSWVTIPTLAAVMVATLHVLL